MKPISPGRTVLLIHNLILLSFIYIQAASGQVVQQLSNGAIESFGAGSPTGWTYTQNTGPANTLDTTHVSPFTNTYPSSTASFFYSSGNSNNFNGPLLSQTFFPVKALSYSFDFDITALTGSGTRVVFSGGGFQPASISLDNSGKLSVFAQGGFEAQTYALTANKWYNVSGQLNINSNLFTLSITPFGGSTTNVGSWGLFPFNQTPTSTVSKIGIDSIVGGSAPTEPTYFDNFSIQAQAAPEPATLPTLAFGVVLLTGWFYHRKNRLLVP